MLGEGGRFLFRALFGLVITRSLSVFVNFVGIDAFGDTSIHPSIHEVAMHQSVLHRPALIGLDWSSVLLKEVNEPGTDINDDNL